MKIALINDTDGRENIGCRLTSSMLKSSLKKLSARATGTVEIIPIPWKFRRKPAFFEEAIFLSMLKGKTLLSKKLLERFIRLEYGKQSLESVNSCDLIVFQPEGSISDSHDLLRVYRLFCLPLYCAYYLDKPMTILNGTFPLFQDIRAEVIRELIRLSDFCALRDKLSADFYECYFCPDAAILWEANSEETMPDQYVLMTTGASFSQNQNHKIAEIALAFCKTNKLKPLVLTMNWQDFSIFRDNVEELGGLFLEYATLVEAADLLSQCYLHIGGRYHMAIFAATLGVPSYMPLTNTHKNQWLSEDIYGVQVSDSLESLELLLPENVSVLAGEKSNTLSSLESLKKRYAQVIELWNEATRKNDLVNKGYLLTQSIWRQKTVISQVQKSYFYQFIKHLASPLRGR